MKEAERAAIVDRNQPKFCGAILKYNDRRNTENLRVKIRFRLFTRGFLTVHNCSDEGATRSSRQNKESRYGRSALTNLKRHSRVYPANLG